MGRWQVPLAFCLVTAVLAGCAQDGGAPVEADAFADLPVAVSASTGAIRGVVVDDRIVPVVGAVLGLAGGALNQSSLTDKEGRFAFGNLQPGTYFLSASAPLHRSVQTSIDVVAGQEPPVTRLQLERQFKQAPYVVQIKQDGFFECSQAGAPHVYSSSNCITDPCPAFQDPSTCNTYPTKMLDNITNQQREWHADVLAGWQRMVFEMTWEPTSQGTSDRMGMVVSTYKPERDPAHSFANYASTSPYYLVLNVGETHETAASVDPDTIPSEGMAQMSYFVSVRPPDDAVCLLWCAPPGLALNQRFTVYLHQFYYGTPPEGWSFVRGDVLPF